MNGYTVVVAARAEEGLRLAKQRTSDLVFVDLMMEEVDAGATVVKEFLMAGGGKVPVSMRSSLGNLTRPGTTATWVSPASCRSRSRPQR